MRRAAMLMLVGILVLGACGGAQERAPSGRAASTSAPPGEPIVIRTRMEIAGAAGAESIATGEVLDGSTLGGLPFCTHGTIDDTHASRDPAVAPYGLIDRTIRCGGTVSMAFTPGPAQGLTQAGWWTIVGGTGAFEDLRGSGEMQTVYDPDDDSLGFETLTGTVTHEPPPVPRSAAYRPKHR